MSKQIKMSDYYKTKHWKAIRNKYLGDDDCVCEICDRPRFKWYKKGPKKGQRKINLRFNLHHKHYNNLYKENRSDLLTLCQFCHDLLHKIEKATNIAPDIYLEPYNLIKEKTNWDYERRK